MEPHIAFSRGFVELLADRTAKKRGRPKQRNPPSAQHARQLLDVLAVLGGVRNACLLDQVFLDCTNWTQLFSQLQQELPDSGLQLIELLDCAVVVHPVRLWEQLELGIQDNFERTIFVDVDPARGEPQRIGAGSARDQLTRELTGALRKLQADGRLDELEDMSIAPTLVGVLLGYPVVYMSPAASGNCLGSRDLDHYTIVAALTAPMASLECFKSHAVVEHGVFSFTTPAGVGTEAVALELERLNSQLQQLEQHIWDRIELKVVETMHPSITL